MDSSPRPTHGKCAPASRSAATPPVAARRAQPRRRRPERQLQAVPGGGDLPYDEPSERSSPLGSPASDELRHTTATASSTEPLRLRPFTLGPQQGDAAVHRPPNRYTRCEWRLRGGAPRRAAPGRFPEFPTLARRDRLADAHALDEAERVTEPRDSLL